METRLVDIKKVITGKYFDPGQIADSGQCFRMRELENGRYCNVAFGKYMEIEKTPEGEIVFYCSHGDYESFWHDYYDLRTDYGVYIEKISDDPFLEAAAAAGGGIRILRQELWEIIITFIISANNNIPRIRNAIETLSLRYGERKDTVKGLTPKGAVPSVYYAFPSPETLALLTLEELRDCGIGYRDRYVQAFALETAESNGENLKKLQRISDHKTAVKELTGIMGIGTKVANCIALFGLHIMDAYPVDTWIKAVIDDIYDGDFDAAPYKGCEGYIQQLQFYYYRKLKGR